MRISRNNYELFFIDYLDGTLNDRQIVELEDFLRLNPDLREELEGMEKIGLSPENVILTDKDMLRKTDTETALSGENFDDYCAAYIEGDLNAEKISALESYIEIHQEHKKDLELYRQTTLLPDSSIVYSNKNNLKKAIPPSKRIYLYTVLSAAAAIVLFMIIFRGIDSYDRISIPLTENSGESEYEAVKTEKMPGDVIAEYQQDEKSGILPPLKEEIERPVIKTLIHGPNEKNGKEVHHLAEKPVSEDIEISGTTLAGLYLPVRAQPDVIKGSLIPDQSGLAITSSSDPDYKSLPDLAMDYVNNKILRRDEPSEEQSKLSLWEIADAGIKGINRFTGADMKLERQSGVDGELKSISFDAGIIAFSRSSK